MRISFILSLSLFLFHNSFGQWAIVRDKDGFVNTRERPNAQSKIIDTLSSGKIVFIDSDPEGEWYHINDDGQDYKDGYIHKSRLQLVDNFTKFKIVKRSDTLLQLKLDSTLLTIKVGKFHKRQHILKYEYKDGKKYLASIDSSNSYPGVIDELPVNEYKSMTIKAGNKEYRLDKKYWCSLYEPDLRRTSVYCDKTTNVIYLEAENSDGVGGYSLFLIISNGQITYQNIWAP
ncbi:MAG TPA: SH3 domain-containing protein [Ferruginibacter sp.]|jgi:hypothetical protein|nr:SH3 domain-containing protein [Ferruginibacter sp.]